MLITIVQYPYYPSLIRLLKNSCIVDYRFLEDHNILYDLQYGFRKNKSTIHYLIQITEQIKCAIEKGMYGRGVFIDLKGCVWMWDLYRP